MRVPAIGCTVPHCSARGRVVFYDIQRSWRPDQWLHPVRLAHHHTHRGGSPPPLIRTFATCAMGWMGSGAGTSVKSLLPPCTDHGIPCQEVCFSMIRAFPAAFLHFPQGIHRLGNGNPRISQIFTDSPRFSWIFRIFYNSLFLVRNHILEAQEHANNHNRDFLMWDCFQLDGARQSLIGWQPPR